MDWIIKTGTDSEGNAVTTTLDCQINVTWTYSHHETISAGSLDDIIRVVFLTWSATDATTGNASHLVTGQSDQTLTGTHEQSFFPSDKIVGNPNAFTGVLTGWTPHSAVTQDQMKTWCLDILNHDGGWRMNSFKTQICHDLYGEHYYAPSG